MEIEIVLKIKKSNQVATKVWTLGKLLERIVGVPLKINVINIILFLQCLDWLFIQYHQYHYYLTT